MLISSEIGWNRAKAHALSVFRKYLSCYLYLQNRKPDRWPQIKSDHFKLNSIDCGFDQLVSTPPACLGFSLTHVFSVTLLCLSLLNINPQKLLNKLSRRVQHYSSMNQVQANKLLQSRLVTVTNVSLEDLKYMLSNCTRVQFHVAQFTIFYGIDTSEGEKNQFKKFPFLLLVQS